MSTFAEQAYQACALKATALGRRLNQSEWLETVQAVYDAAHPPRKPRSAPRIEIEEVWLQELEQNPAYAGIDVKRELGKAQAWASIRGVGVTRRRFINWLNKAAPEARPIAFNGQGATSFTRPTTPNLTEPSGWREWVRENAQDPSNADKPWQELDTVAQRYIQDQLRKTA